MRTIIIIPTYNESQNIAELILLIWPECNGFDVNVLVVDSASPDGTADKVRELQKNEPRLFLLEQSAKLGLGRAYLDGMTWVLSRSYDAIVTMDADMSHHPKYLRSMLDTIKDHDLVIGSRYIPGGRLQDWPAARRFLSRFANWYASTLTGLPFHDLTSGFQCFRADLLRKILRYNIHTEGYAFLVELKFLSIIQRARFHEIPIVFTDRTHGTTKISKRVILESMLFVLTRFFQRRRVRKALSTASVSKDASPA
ncbi:MAG: polyprenol monophosphomannose synthase [Candidatus Omnitrophota bacterium]